MVWWERDNMTATGKEVARRKAAAREAGQRSQSSGKRGGLIDRLVGGGERDGSLEDWIGQAGT